MTAQNLRAGVIYQQGDQELEFIRRQRPNKGNTGQCFFKKCGTLKGVVLTDDQVSREIKND